MQQNVVQLTQELIAIPSESQGSNRAIADYLAGWLNDAAFTIERLAFTDGSGAEKVSLVAKKGAGHGGLGFFAHSDTVPGDAGWQPFAPVIEAGHLIGRGSCDMKGPLAAALLAATAVDAATLQQPLYVVIAADEEIGFGGAYQVAGESRLLAGNWPTAGIITDPTSLRPVYAHKGGAQMRVTALGRAAHTSTDKGISANFLIAPFLAEMAELAKLFKREARFQNHDFDPPTNSFNLTINDGGTAGNVTAAKTVATLGLRTMPNDQHEEAVGMVVQSARKYGFAVDVHISPPFYTAPTSTLIQLAQQITGVAPETVPYGTEALVYQAHTQLLVLGAGNIAQAHTVGEWIDVAELERSVAVYQQLIAAYCY